MTYGHGKYSMSIWKTEKAKKNLKVSFLLTYKIRQTSLKSIVNQSTQKCQSKYNSWLLKFRIEFESKKKFRSKREGDNANQSTSAIADTYTVASLGKQAFCLLTATQEPEDDVEVGLRLL